MNASFGLIRTPDLRFRNKKEKYQIMADIALKRIDELKNI